MATTHLVDVVLIVGATLFKKALIRRHFESDLAPLLCV